MGPRIALQTERPSLTLGSEYGEHTVCPDGLGADSIVYSVGVGQDVSFDRALAERFGLTVHAFDPTPASVAWVEAQDLPGYFRMNAIGLGTEDGTARFFKPSDPGHISHSVLSHDRVQGDSINVPIRCLATLMAERGHAHIDVLKLDIEGLEYDVLDQLCHQGLQVRQLLVEFHHQLTAIPYRRTRRTVEKLSAHGYQVFHVRGGEREVSLIRDIP
jgi:FkbM family methyltransferase